VTALDPPALYIGHAREMTVVSTRPLKVERGGARTYRWGRVAEIVPGPGAPPLGFTPAHQMLVLSFALYLIAAGVAVATGSMWAYLPALAATVALIRSARLEGRRIKPGTITPPEPDSLVLVAPEDRNDLWSAIQVGKRICGTLPALAGMVDTHNAERLLASALFDVARVLGQRQEVRGLLNELRRQGHHGLPPDSPALRKMKEQKDRLKRALSDLDADVARKIAGLKATDAAGLNFLREREIHRMTSRVDQTLASLTSADHAGMPDSGLELADEMAAVLAVYQELNERYGAGS